MKDEVKKELTRLIALSVEKGYYGFTKELGGALYTVMDFYGLLEEENK